MFPVPLKLRNFDQSKVKALFIGNVELGVGSAPEPINHDRINIVELLSHNDHSARGIPGRGGKFTCLEKRKEKKERSWCCTGGLFRLG